MYNTSNPQLCTFYYPEDSLSSIEASVTPRNDEQGMKNKFANKHCNLGGFLFKWENNTISMIKNNCQMKTLVENTYFIFHAQNKNWRVQTFNNIHTLAMRFAACSACSRTRAIRELCGVAVLFFTSLSCNSENCGSFCFVQTFILVSIKLMSD